MKKTMMKSTFLKLIMVSSISALLLTACMKKEKPEDADQAQTTHTEEVQESDFQELDNVQEQAEYTDLEELDDNSGTAEIAASEEEAYVDPTPSPSRAATSSANASSSSASPNNSSSANSASTVSEDVVNDEHALSADATEDDAVATAIRAAQPALQ